MNRSCAEFQLSLFLVALLFTGFASSPAFAHSDSAYANQYLYIPVPTPWFDNYFEERLDWMADLENGLTLSELSLPGTHDSMAYPYDYFNPANLLIRTQSLSLIEQLRAGIRVLDLRAAIVGEDLIMFHGDFELDSTLDEVLLTVKGFLEDHSSEIVILNLKNEHPSSDGDPEYLDFEEALAVSMSAIGTEFFIDSTGTIEETRTCFCELSTEEQCDALPDPGPFCTDKDGVIVYPPDEYIVLIPAIPTVSDESRGKMLIVHGRSLNEDSFSDFSVGDDGETLADFLLEGGIGSGQDDFFLDLQHDLPEKWRSIKEAYADINNRTPYERQTGFSLNYLSAAGLFFTWPYWVASGHIGQETWAPRQATGCVSGWLGLCDLFSPDYWDDFPRVDCFLDACTIAFEGTNTLFKNHHLLRVYHAFRDDELDDLDLYTGIVLADFPGDGLISSVIVGNFFPVNSPPIAILKSITSNADPGECSADFAASGFDDGVSRQRKSDCSVA